MVNLLRILRRKAFRRSFIRTLMDENGMPLAGAWFEVWIYLVFVFGWTLGARPRFDTSTDMGLVLVPADAEVDSVIFRLRATDQDADFPLVFEITATITPVVRIDNLPCTLYNKVCQANVILTRRLTPGRLHDFAVRVRDSKGDSNSMQATISVTNATTSRDKIFPHIPSLIMVPEDTRPGKELDYLLVRANQWSGKPVYIELWQPKELFTIRQRQTPSQTRGVITLIGELDFETQSMYTLTMYATDPYTEPGKDTRNIAGLNVVVIVQDVQDVPPIFTLAPPLTRINNSVQPGDVILRVHAEDGDKGVPREITYGLVSEGNPFTPFFNISETTGEIILARPLEDLTQITHVGAPVVLTVVAEEIRRSTEEPPAQATVVDVGLLLGEPGNSPPYFESDNYIASIDENLEPGTLITFPEQFSTRVRDEDIGKAGVFALKLFNNNGTFEINPTVAERNADFIITVRDNTLIDYEMYKTLQFKIVAQEVGPATNLSASVPVTIFIKDVNDNPPVFDEDSYEVTLSENVTAGTRVVQVHATDKDTGNFGVIQYTRIIGQGHEAFAMDPDTGLITVAMGSSLDRENAAQLQLTVEARDENGHGNRGVVPLIVNLLDVNDNAPIFEKDVYEFMLNANLTNFTSPAIIKAIDADAEPPNNEVRYELVHGNYENKFFLDEITGELFLRSPITKVRRKKQSAYGTLATRLRKDFHNDHENSRESLKTTIAPNVTNFNNSRSENESIQASKELIASRFKRADDDALFTLTARAYDLGVPHLSSVTQVRVLKAAGTEAHIVMFVVPGEHPDPGKTAETLATITGGRVTVQEIRPYVPQNQTDGTGVIGTVKKSIVVARVEQSGSEASFVDIEKIRQALAANGVGIISGTESSTEITTGIAGTKSPVDGNTGSSGVHTTIINKTVTTIHNEEVTWYKAENELLFWLLIILGLLMLLAIAALIICCICPGCPFYMAPRKRRVHSSETLIVRSEGRPKRHLHRKQAAVVDASWPERKQAWSADPTRRNWQFNRRNTKNCGQASLPGDVVYISNHQNDIQANIESLRLRDGPIYDHARRSRIDEQERMYLEDIEAQKVRDYEAAEADSLHRHELERGSEIRHGVDVYRYVEPDVNEEETTVREQHFYREGNAEVLRLVTRGQVEDTDRAEERAHHATLIVDGKDILLRRFIEDQKSKHEMSIHGGQQDDVRSMESHHRAKEMQQQVQQEIILIPDRLEERRHVEEIGPNVQRLVIDHEYEESLKADGKEGQRQTQVRIDAAEGIGERVQAKQHAQSVNVQTYSFHDIELARQNALLTRLLLEREARVVGGTVMDSTSYLETQSLPGQVAIATQTDRTAATQTERHVRSRSDNDESEDDAKHRKKKSKKRYDGESRRIRTLWMKSPIEEEGPCFDKRLSILRKKVKEVKEGRKASLEPDVLREISDSLDGNGSSCRGDEEETRTYKRSTEETSIRYKVLEDDDTPTSNELSNEKEKRTVEKNHQRTVDKPKADVTESTSSQEEPAKSRADIKVDEKSPKKEGKHKASQKKIESVVKPSFRILEREISILTTKLSKLGDKKVQDSTGSDSTTRGKPLQSKHEATKDQKAKRSEEFSSQSSKPSAEEAPSTSKIPEDHPTQRKESTIAKTRQKLKYQQAHVMSTGSSEYDETFEKPRKQIPSSMQDNFRQRHATTGRSQHTKTKRQIERKDQKKSTSHEEHDSDRPKEAASKEAVKTIPSEKAGRQIMTRVPKLTGTRREYVSEEFSTSTGSDRVDNKRDTRRDSDKKSSTTLESVVSRVSQRKVRKTREQPGEKCEDDSSKDIRKEDSERQAVMELGAQTKSRGNGKREERRPVVEPVSRKIVVERKVVLPVKEDEEVSFKDALKELARQEDAIHERIQRHADDVDARREEVRKFEGLKDVVEEEVQRVRIERQNNLEESEESGDNDKIDKADVDEMASKLAMESKERLSDSKKMSNEDKGSERENVEVEVKKVLTDKVDIKRDTEERVEESTESVKREVERKIEVDAGTEEKKFEKVEGTANMQREVEQKMEDVTKIEREAKKKLDDSVQKIEHISSFVKETDKKIEQIEDGQVKETEEIKSDTERSVEDIDSAGVNIEGKPEKPKGFEDYERSDQRPYTCEIVNILAAEKGICEPDAESITLPQTIGSHQPKSPTEKSPIQASSPEVPLHAAELKSETSPVNKSPEDKKSPEPSASPLPVNTPSPPISKSPEDKQFLEPITSPKPTKTPTPPHVKSPAEKSPPILSPPVKSPNEKISPQPTSPPSLSSEIRAVSKSPEEKQLPPSKSVSPASEIRATAESLEEKQSPESAKRTSPTTPEFPSNRKSSDEKLKLSPGISPIGSRVPSGDESVDKKSSPQPPIATPVELQTSSISKSPELEKSPESVKSASPPISRDKSPDKDAFVDSGTVSPPVKSETSVNGEDLNKIKPNDAARTSPVACQVLSPNKSSDEDTSKKDTLSASPQPTPVDKKQEEDLVPSDETITNNVPEKKDTSSPVDDTHVKQTEEKRLSEVTASVSPVKDAIEQSDQTDLPPEKSENLQETETSPKRSETPQETHPLRSPDAKPSIRRPDSSTHEQHPEKPESHQPPSKPSSPPSHKEQSLPSKQIVAGQVVHPSEEQMFAEKADKTAEPPVEQLNSGERSDKILNVEDKQDRPPASSTSEPTPETTSETSPEAVPETTSETNVGEQPEAAEKYTDVSHPIFTPVTDQLDDSDESDSSSDISRKTALNAGPYQTPRHRARKLSDRENIETEEEEEPEVGSLPPAESVDSKSLIEMEGDKAAELPVDEKANEQEAEIADPPGGQTILIEKEEVAGKDTSVDNLIEAVASASTAIFLDDKVEREAAGVNDKGTDQGELDLKADQKETARELERGERTLDARERTEGGSNGKDGVPSTPASRQTSKSNPKKKAKKYETFKRTTKEKRSTVEEVLDETKRDSSPGKITRSVRRRSQKADVEPEKRRESDRTKRSRRKEEEDRMKQSQQKSLAEREKKSSGSGPDKSSSPTKAPAEIDTSKTQSKYMAWYKQTKDESERRRAEAKEAKEEDDEQLPRWLRRSMRQRKSLEEKRKVEKTPEMTPCTRRKVKPLVNVESEQLKAIVRQGRKLRKAEGGQNEDPPVQIFATTPPKRPPDAKHHLVQHSEYKYEKMPAPFYLHPPPPAPHPSPQLSPERFEPEASAECRQPEIDPGISVGLQGGARLRHQQLLEKKSVFDIAYSEAAPSQLRSDSTTPPS